MEAPKLLFILFVSLPLLCYSQAINTSKPESTLSKTLNAAGGVARGSSGSISYSIGEIFFSNYSNSNIKLFSGIQQTENKKETPKSITVIKDIKIYPNPTITHVTIDYSEDKKGTYLLFDGQGRFIKDGIVNKGETKIDFTYMSSSTYLLRLIIDGKVSQTFKILKT